jgi:hypothetical protein
MSYVNSSSSMDQRVARPLPTQDNTNTIKANIRTHDPSVQAGEDISRLDRAATVTGPKYHMVAARLPQPKGDNIHNVELLGVQPRVYTA